MKENNDKLMAMIDEKEEIINELQDELRMVKH